MICNIAYVIVCAILSIKYQMHNDLFRVIRVLGKDGKANLRKKISTASPSSDVRNA